MKIPKNTNILFIAIVFFLMLVGNAYAQEQGFRWGKWSVGRDIFGGGGMPDKIIDSYIDSVGNTYIFGKCGKDARLGENGPYICPMDSISGYSVGNAPGIFLAKIDSTGTIFWCKSVRGSTPNNLTLPWNMVVKNDRITVAFDTRFNANIYDPTGGPECWLYFLDTLVRSSGNHFYVNENVTYFVTLDLDGNTIEVHDVRMWAKQSYERPIYTTCWLVGLGNSRFGIDDDGCIHLFTSIEGTILSEDSLHKAYIIVDGDTNRKYQLNLLSHNSHYCFNVYFKMSNDWHLIDLHYLIDTIVGWMPADVYSFVQLRFGRVLVEGDDLYVNGYFDGHTDAIDLEQTLTDTSTFSATIYLDSIHYLKIENLRDFIFMPFLIKLNKNGEIVWVQQLYTENANDGYRNYISTGNSGLVLDEDNVYMQYLASSNSNIFYLDSAHAIPLADNQSNTHIIIVGYDKITGDPVDYYYIDPTAEYTKSQSLAVLGDELILDVGFLYLDCTEHTSDRKSELCRINKYTKAVSRSAPITFTSRSEIYSTAINSNGWVFRSSTGDGARVCDSISVGPEMEASVMTFFYDSSLDMRIKPCPQVDSLWGSMTVQHTATLSWHSQFSHIGYEVAYIPEGGSWDDAASLETSDTSAAITLPDGRCYLFRIRGLCDGRRVATSPWSNPITLCPEMGIADVEHLTAAITPNPTTGMVRITSSEPMRQVVIYDLSGKQVQNSDHRTPITELTLDLSTLPEGSYIVKVVTTKDHHEYLKLIKQ